MQRPAPSRPSSCPPRPASAARSPDAVSPAAAGALGLQAAVGNRATARLLRKGRKTSEFTFVRPKKETEKSARSGAWFNKTPRADEKTPDRPKYKAEWLIKSSTAYQNTRLPSTRDNLAAAAIQEVFAANLFTALAGAQHGARYRIVHGAPTERMPQEASERWVASKTIEGFENYKALGARGATPLPEKAIPGAARSLVMALFLGEGDFNAGNYGLTPAGDFAKVDFGTAFEFDTVPVDRLMSRDGLIQGASGIDLTPSHLDDAEREEALDDLLTTGKHRIRVVAEDMADEFVGIGGEQLLYYICRQLVGRLETLRTLLT